METNTPVETRDRRWLDLVSGLPDTCDQIGEEIISKLRAKGYFYFKHAISLDNYEIVASRLGSLISRSDVIVDADRAIAQEKTRVVKGRPGPYQAGPFGFHTDNIRVAIASFFCVEQDAVDGALLLLDTSDLAEHFSEAEIDALSRVELWAPPVTQPGAATEDFFYLSPLLTREGKSHLIYYVPWLLKESYDDSASETLKKFALYVKQKESTDLIRLPLKKGESVFIDNQRMLHGRAAIAEDSKRHLIRLYIKLPSRRAALRIRELRKDEVSAATNQAAQS